MARTGACCQLVKNIVKYAIARSAWLCIVFACFLFFLAFQGTALADDLVMVTQAAGVEGNNSSQATDIIADGNILVIQSDASNLSGAASGAATQILHYNFITGQWTLVSATAAGTEGDGASGHPDITADNRYVVFHSAATNLGGTGANQQIFRKDLNTGEIVLVSRTAAGVEANGECRRPVISEDGSRVAFESSATNLGGTGTYRQTFLKNLNTGELKIASSSATGVEASDNTGHPSISADGKYVTFHSKGSTLHSGMSGSYEQVLRKDVDSGAVVLVSCKADGTEANDKSRYATMNGDGRYVTFYSTATNLVTPAPTVFDQVYRKDLATGSVDLVSCNAAGEPDNAGAGNYGQNSISLNGRYVSFVSDATNLLPALAGTNTQAFRKDIVTGELVLISANGAGTEGDATSWRPAMTPDGCFISFYADSTNLVSSPAASGIRYQVYRRDMNCFSWLLFGPK